MKNIKKFVLILSLALLLSSCANIQEKMEKIQSKVNEKSSEKSEETNSENTTATSDMEKESETVEESKTNTEETTTTTKKENKKTSKSTTEAKKKKDLVSDLEFKASKTVKKMVSLPYINEEILDIKEVKEFNKEVEGIKASLIDFSKASITKGSVMAEYEYFDTDEILSLEIFYFDGFKEDKKTLNYTRKTITIDKKEKKVLSNAEILELLGIERIAFVNTYIDFIQGYLYHDEELLGAHDAIESISFEAGRNLEENINAFPLYFEDVPKAYLPFINSDASVGEDIEFIFYHDRFEFMKENKLGAFSKTNLENDENIDSKTVDLSTLDGAKSMLLHFYTDGKLEVQEVKRDFSSNDVLVKKLAYEGKYKENDDLVLKVDNIIPKNPSESGAFYRLVFKDKHDDVFVMDMNYLDPSYDGLIFEYAINPREDYLEKLEKSNDKLKSAVNLLGIPMQRINELYGYRYKIKPRAEKYEMKYENEEFPLLIFSDKKSGSTVEEVFSDFTGYNMIDDIYVGMTAVEVEKILGGYESKVVGTNGLYDSYTLFNVGGYELYVYGKDSDLLSFGMMLKYKQD